LVRKIPSEWIGEEEIDARKMAGTRALKVKKKTHPKVKTHDAGAQEKEREKPCTTEERTKEDVKTKQEGGKETESPYEKTDLQRAARGWGGGGVSDPGKVATILPWPRVGRRRKKSKCCRSDPIT